MIAFEPNITGCIYVSGDYLSILELPCIVTSSTGARKMAGVIKIPCRAKPYTFETKVFLTNFLTWGFVKNGSLPDYASALAAGPSLKQYLNQKCSKKAEILPLISSQDTDNILDLSAIEHILVITLS